MNYNTMSQPKVNFQTNDDSSFKIQFTDNDRYLNDGTVILPKNSLGYIVDESELITLVKPCGDPYISFKITDTQFANLAAFEDWFAENAVSTGGGSVDPEQLAGLIADAEYVSSATTIYFYNLDGDEVCHIDATDFIKDGMVSNVEVVGTNLVITFNTDAGKNPISIPLTSFFDGSQYYDKTAIDTMLATKADTSAVTVDEYTIYATRDNNISTAYTSTPITWVKIMPKGNLGKSGSLQFSGITGYLYLQNIDYVNGTYTVGSGSLDPSLVSGLSITFEDGAMIVEVDASNPITYASFSNTVIEYVKTVIPEKAVSDAVYDNLYPLIKKVDDSLTSITVNSASTTQYEISLKPRNNAKDILPNQIVSLGGYLSYSGTTLKAEAYVNTGTDTLTTVAPTINSSSRTDYYFTDNVGQTAEANHMEIQILASDTVTLAFYGYDNTGRLTSKSLVVSGGTVTSGYTWPSEAIYSLSDGVLTVDYAFTGTTQVAPVSINRIIATNQYGSTASVSDIVGYVKALLKDKVEVTEYIDNTLKPTIDGKQDALQYYSEDTEDGTVDINVESEMPILSMHTSSADGTEDLIELDNRVFLNDVKDDGSGNTSDAGIIIDNGEISFDVTRQENGETIHTYMLVNPTGVTINDDAVVTESALSGKQDTLVAGSGITISGNVISADGGGGGMSEDDELLLATALVDLNDRKMDTADAKAEFAKYQRKGDYITSAVLDTRLADYETALDEQNVEEVASYALNDLNARLTTVETALGGLSLSAITESQWATISGSANPSTIYIITNNE